MRRSRRDGRASSPPQTPRRAPPRAPPSGKYINQMKDKTKEMNKESFMDTLEKEMKMNESYEIGTDAYRIHTMKMTPGQPIQNFRKYSEIIKSDDIEKFAIQWFCSTMGNPKKPMGRQSSWETSGSWELGTWRFLGGNWEARVRVRVRESWEAKKMTKKTRGIEPCLAHESWSSLEESASPLQHSLKPACKILAI